MRSLAVASAAAMLSTWVVVVPDEARASADGCDNAGFPAACIQVQGAGRHVDWVRGGVRLRARGSVRGHFEIWWGDGRVDTPDETLSNDSYIAHTKWGQKVVLDREVAKGTMCSRFWERVGDGWNDKGTACVNIG